VTVTNRFHATVFTIVCILTAACSGSVGDTNKNGSPAGGEPTPIASTNVVKVSAEELTLGKGESATAVVRLQIQQGYHVNANPATFPYLIATQLEVTPAGGLSIGAITYPDPLSKTFSFSADAPLKVYEGETSVKAILKADASAQTGKHNLSAKLRVQACDDQVCYPPGTIDLTVPVTIK
jgi:DsbC/DsbD-like thiol-disulfide interchange protein